MLITLGKDEIGEIPNPAVLVSATPSAEKNRLITNNMYLFNVSFFVDYNRKRVAFQLLFYFGLLLKC